MTPSRTAWSVWAVGLAAYIVAVLHRTSFGVAGLDAAQRFDDLAPACWPGFIVLQLLVYAACRCPVGVLLDRFGARRLVVAGALIMAAGAAAARVRRQGCRSPICGAGAGRGRRRADVHQRAAAGRRLVPAAPGAGDHPAHRADSASSARCSPPSRWPPCCTRRGWTTAFPGAAAVGRARGRWWPRSPSHDAPDRPRRSRRGRRPPRRCGRDLRDRLAAPGHPARALDALRDPVLPAPCSRCMWGYPFLVSGAGADRRRQPAGCSPCWCAVGIVSGPVFGGPGPAPPAAPVLAGPRRHRGERRGAGRRCWPGRAGRRCGCSSLLVVALADRRARRP